MPELVAGIRSGRIVRVGEDNTFFFFGHHREALLRARPIAASEE